MSLVCTAASHLYSLAGLQLLRHFDYRIPSRHDWLYRLTYGPFRRCWERCCRYLRWTLTRHRCERFALESFCSPKTGCRLPSRYHPVLSRAFDPMTGPSSLFIVYKGSNEYIIFRINTNIENALEEWPESTLLCSIPTRMCSVHSAIERRVSAM